MRTKSASPLSLIIDELIVTLPKAGKKLGFWTDVFTVKFLNQKQELILKNSSQLQTSSEIYEH